MIFPVRCILVAISFACAAGEAHSANVSLPQPAIQSAPLTSAQIIDELQRHNQMRADALKNAMSTRVYQVEYQGFSAQLTARMEVEYHYDTMAGKSFHILKQSGSKMLCEKVLKRAMETEERGLARQKRHGSHGSQLSLSIDRERESRWAAGLYPPN